MKFLLFSASLKVKVPCTPSVFHQLPFQIDVLPSEVRVPYITPFGPLASTAPSKAFASPVSGLIVTGAETMRPSVVVHVVGHTPTKEETGAATGGAAAPLCDSATPDTSIAGTAMKKTTSFDFIFGSPI